MSVHKLIFDHYNSIPSESYDGINLYIYDALGFLRWHSPADDFEAVKYSNSVIKDFLTSKNEKPSSKYNLIFNGSKKSTHLNINFSFVTKKESIDFFMSKERMSNEILLTIQDKLNVFFELNKASLQENSDDTVTLTIFSKTSLNSQLIKKELIKEIHSFIDSALFKEFNIKDISHEI